MRQAGSITPFQGLHHHVHVAIQKYGLWACMILDKKASISSFFIILTALFKSFGPVVWFTAISLLTESSAQWHANKQDTLNAFKEANNSSISLSLITFMIQLMVGVPRVTSLHDPKAVESGTTRAT